MKIQKILAVLLSLAMMLSLAARCFRSSCGDGCARSRGDCRSRRVR